VTGGPPLLVTMNSPTGVDTFTQAWFEAACVATGASAAAPTIRTTCPMSSRFVPHLRQSDARFVAARALRRR
jgi:hypothetical protein